MTTNPLMPIVIKYDEYNVTSKDMGRLLSALKHPNRIREIDLKLNSAELDKFFRFKATKCPFPALDSLTIYDKRRGSLKVPATFLKGTNLRLRLRSLDLAPISLDSVSRLLSSATALTDLFLVIDGYCHVPNLSRLRSQLQGLPHLRYLNLTMTCFANFPVQLSGLTEPKESFPLAKLTSFNYRGLGTFLEFLMMGFKAPSIQSVNILLNNPTMALLPLPRLAQFISGAEKHHHAVHVVLKRNYFDFSLLTPSESVDRFSLCLILHPPLFRGSEIQNWMMGVASVFSAKLSTVEELVLINDSDARGEEVIPWRTLFELFPSVKNFRIQGTDNRRVASALRPYYSGINHSVLPALEKITLSITSDIANRSSELAVFQPFVTARQQAGRQVQVTCSLFPFD